MVGDPIQPLSAEIITRYSGNPEQFAARQLTPKILRDTDLVLTMSTGHRGEVLKLDPSLLRRTFTIREFARMLEVLEERGESGTETGVPPSDAHSSRGDARTLWQELPGRAASVRHLSLAADPADNDVVDPYLRSADYYNRMEDELAPAILSVLRFARLNAPAKR